MTATVHSFPDRFDRDGVRWEPWCKADAVARHFAVSLKTVRRWQREGMPSEAFGGSRRYRIADCELWHRSRNAS